METARHSGGPLPLPVPSTPTKLPKSVRDHARFVRLGETGAPALLAHPDWATPVPFCIWLHGRTANKELDPGRYTRWLRAGLGVCAIDLPGHGERADASRQGPDGTVGVIAEAVAEIDPILAGLDEFGVFDRGRSAIGGMSMGGMIALRRLCEPHGFICAVVEATCGDLGGLYFPDAGSGLQPWPVAHDPAEVSMVDPAANLDGFEPLPLLALHSEADEMVPWRVQAKFLERLRAHYRDCGVSPDLIEVRTWPETGAPAEHVGFGRFSNEAKNIQTAFLVEHLIGADR